MKKTLIILFLAGFSVVATGQSIQKNHLDGAIYVQVKHGITSLEKISPFFSTWSNEAQVKKIYKPFLGGNNELDRIYRVEFANFGGVNDLIKNFNQTGMVEYAEPVPYNEITYIPNDYSGAWHLPKIQADKAWDFSKGNSNIKIAILDNAISLTHEDLVDNIWVNPGESENLLDDDINLFIDDVNGYDVADLDNDPNPPALNENNGLFFHGTHVAAIASGVTDNATGYASIGFNSTILPVKVSQDASNGRSVTHGYEGLYYATQAGADIANMSWGGYGLGATAEVIITYASTNGVTMIAAAGNDDTTDQFFPAAHDLILAVGATRFDDQKAGFSNYGEFIDVMAPGDAIISAHPLNDAFYSHASGTSMASPLTAGLAALILDEDSLLSAEEIFEVLKMGCENINNQNPNYLGMIGSGRINAYNSLLLVQQSSVTQRGAKLAKVYPNPSSNHVSIQTSGNIKVSEVEILNQIGQSVFHDKLAYPKDKLTLPIKKLPSGVYTILLYSSAGTQASRIIKE